MSTVESKTVVLGVTGSIAAYKACDIVSRLKAKNINVHVILTAAGAQFITPVALETMSKNPVVTDMFSRSAPWEVEHIALAKRADAFLVAPATANFIGKFASGIADDMLTTTVLATRAPILIAPAMNVNMLENPAVQHNITVLRDRGCSFIEPQSGMLACGDVGKGRLADVDTIVEHVIAALYPIRDLEGKHILVSAGPTCERLDPVRYLTNRSSGKMGYSIAEAAACRGARVTLISGPTALEAPSGVERINVVSSNDMYCAVLEHFPECNALIMAAAPADFTPKSVADNKIKKTGESGLTLELEPTKDILRAAGKIKGNKVLIGFAAETQNIELNAAKKLESKNLDMIAANDVSRTDAGFGVSTNSVALYHRSGEKELSGSMTKRALADWLLDRVVKKLN